MSLLNITAIAVALAMDAFAVAIVSGVCLQSVGLRQTLRLAWHFGLFQALMPIIGWSAGITARAYIETYAHWVAFGLLWFVGLHMIITAVQGDDRQTRPKDPTRGMTMVLLSVAVSIDALAVGFSLAMIKVAVWTPALIIGLVAGLFTIIGIHLGCKIGSFKSLGRYAEVIGGVVLLVIGLKIL